MDTMHANPVEQIRKDIYIIENDINDFVYIGQSKNVKSRFKSHKKKYNSSTLIGSAIAKYGSEHFSCRILEHNVQNYDEREIYWINYYNSIWPNGYNIMPGGREPPHYAGEKSTSSIISDKTVSLLIQDLRNTKVPYSKLANKYGISKRQVMRINNGESRKQKNETYPIREIKNTYYKLSTQDVNKIIHDLRFTYKLTGEIAREFNVSVNLIDKVNNGTAYKHLDIEYPIREWKSCGKSNFSYNQVTEIIHLLKNTNFSLRQIAKMYNVNHSQIMGICSGSFKKYRRKEEKYPLRKHS